MVPPPVDPVLLREHSFQDTGNLVTVLNPDTFYHTGFKSTRNYGLGYMNYNLGLKDDVYEKSWLHIFRSHIYDKFTLYLILLLLSVIIWFIIFLTDVESISDLFQLRHSKGSFRRYRKMKGKVDEDVIEDDNDIEYHHVKV
ncbi:hypothetical protein Kpol_2000p73 [Vanderwaltozyma polyspora DSM 70294]|uniref:Uncharacterized protein n=1 Tax=Vanderwaltozyma polyspora (strain ATCC 22028 / DSM 70294 / BCRC 21397 / CBS 2163 / NBRC 10782 / NRRL Y-8283 / UCD 57-17) TaxID=436907 RepID=A7TF80_VANPO|nr:uncharacterized protein Kpol_2000p73 [Vanderwaltozyma polyspora DSM 70294]EDO19105.1 hypothetical protein Kpol_2000p73 [Vanderwaltozyma polyspora DSM 70294]